MPRTDKRRHAPTTAPPSAAQSLDAFARVSKSSGASLKIAAGKEAAGKGPAVKELAAATDTVTATTAAATRKRKAAAVEGAAADGYSRRTLSSPPGSDDERFSRSVLPKRLCRRVDASVDATQEATQEATQKRPSAPATPAPNGKRVAKAAPSSVESAHRPSRSTIIAESRRRSSKPHSRIEVVIAAREASNKKHASKHAPSADRSLPRHLAELVDLNRAFLRTVAVHIAHAGSNVPIDMGTLLPQISRTWGKRQVTVEDIRRCVAVQTPARRPDAASPFIVSDYGRGKICIELAPGCDGASVDEERLGRQFRDNLGALCDGRAPVDDAMDVDVPLESLSIADLPQAAVTDVGAAARANPMLAKGQRALSDLRSDLAAKQRGREARRQAHASDAMLHPDGSKMGLLDRLRVKQLARANEALPPTGPELQRRAALNRVADVAATISMLSLASPLSLPRQAFTMAALSEKVRDSQRTPVSAEEAEACVRLMAEEVAPEWLRVVTLGGRENVVIQRAGQPIDRVIQQRVQRLLQA